MFLSIAIIIGVLLVLLYNWSVARSAQRQPETFKDLQLPFRMIYVHMDGCGYCERFTPVWMQFTQQHAVELRNKGISVEHYDRADHKWSELGIEVNGFPTILMISTRDNSKVGTFSSERTVPNLYQWALSTAQQQR
jgi:hypothetical protein